MAMKFDKAEDWIRVKNHDYPIAIVNLGSSEAPDPLIGSIVEIENKSYEIVSVGRFERGDFGPGENCGLEVKPL
jgi:hypothetical protein